MFSLHKTLPGQDMIFFVRTLPAHACRAYRGYSYRRDSTGSILAALRAGKKPANKPIKLRIRVVDKVVVQDMKGRLRNCIGPSSAASKRRRVKQCGKDEVWAFIRPPKKLFNIPWTKRMHKFKIRTITCAALHS